MFKVLTICFSLDIEEEIGVYAEDNIFLMGVYKGQLEFNQ